MNDYKRGLAVDAIARLRSRLEGFSPKLWARESLTDLSEIERALAEPVPPQERCTICQQRVRRRRLGEVRCRCGATRGAVAEQSAEEAAIVARQHSEPLPLLGPYQI